MESAHRALPPPAGRHGWWMQEALADDAGEPCPPLIGDNHADILILGGGYTGMWAAYFLTQHEPSASIALLEADICGGGPSGRNGGFVTGWWDDIHVLAGLYGDRAALRACRAVADSVHAIGAWCGEHDVDAWYRRAGFLAVSASPAQDGSWSMARAEASRLGAAGEYVELSPKEVASRCASPVFRGGVLMREAATVQPARLARGLRRVLLERGVRIFEYAPALRLRVGPPVEVQTPAGTVRAERGVLAPGAWAARWKPFARTVAVWGSYIVLTAPAPERLQEVGWTGGEGIADCRTSLHYFRTTPDGRIAFGGRGRTAWWGRIGRRLDYDEASIRAVAAGFRRMFPSFRGVPLEAGWGGPIDVSPSHLPRFGRLGPKANVAFGFGYTGNGVGPSHLGGRILASLALGVEDETTTLPFVDYRPRRYPPEPLRSMGAMLVRGAIVRQDEAEERDRRAHLLVREVARLPRRLGYEIGPE